MIARAFSLAGALLFAASLAYFIWVYLFELERRTPASTAAGAWGVNAGLFLLFALHHSVFARRAVRAWIARQVSARLERSLYVWIASLTFFAVVFWWMPFGSTVWHAEGAARVILRTAQLGAIGFTLWAARALDGLALAGLRQLDAPLPASGVEAPTATLRLTGPYGIVRHPIYLGWLFIVWPAPTMTLAHLLFASLSTAYLMVATLLEERSLRETFGPAYADYSRRVRYRIVPGLY